MNPGNRIMELLAMLSEQTQSKVSAQRLDFYVECLVEMDHQKVITALQKLLRSATRFPTVAEIEKAMGISEPTERDQALLIAERICNAIPRIGTTCGIASSKAVEDVIGKSAFKIVTAMGGWNRLVEQAGDGMGILRAQIRDRAESSIRLGEIGDDDPRDEQLISHSEAIAQKRPLLAAEQRDELTEKRNALLLESAKRKEEREQRRQERSKEIRDIFFEFTGERDLLSDVPTVDPETFRRRLEVYRRHDMVNAMRSIATVMDAKFGNEAAKLEWGLTV